MRWKYYLRGLGCGILVATIILAITLRVQKEQLTDSEIIERAKALGMVMEDSQKGSLWKFDDTEDEDTTDTQPAMAGQEPVNSEGSSNGQEPTTPESSPNVQGPTTPEGNAQGQAAPASEGGTTEQGYVTIEIQPGEYLWTLSKKLKEKGLITDAEEFRSYMNENGYEDKLVNGTYQVPENATMEEMAVMFTSVTENTP